MTGVQTCALPIYLLQEVGIKISNTADFYTNAVRCLNKVINSGSYAIEYNYFNNFLLENGGSKENIFTIVEDGTTNNERDQYSCKNKLRICYLSLHYKGGTIDRLDSKAGVARVIDYKTGSTDLLYKSMADVFGVGLSP